MKTKLIIIALIVFGFILRVAALDIRPVGFTWDEAALGYNAYSLLQTARDEYGKLAPVIFKSFGDYKPGLYIYFTVPAVKAFGLNEFATRLPSAIFGTLLLAIIFVLSRLLFPNNLDIGIWSLGLASINPWLIQFSRGAWEANLALLLTTLAIILFIKKSSLWFLFFGLSFWSYQGAKLFTPLILITLFLIYFKKINFKKYVLPLLLLLLLLLPIAKDFISQSGRLKVFSVFSYTRNPEDVSDLLRQDNTSSKNWIYYLFHSEILDQSRGVLQRYLSHLSPRFLFSEGDWTNLRHSTYKQGYFYLIEVIPLVLGFYLLAKFKSRSSLLLFSWILIAPIPSAFSRDLVSAVRALPLAVPLIILSGAGMTLLVKRRLFFLFYFLLLLFLFTYYLEFYYLHSPYYQANQWVYSYKQAFQLIKQYEGKFDHIYFTDKLGQPYIFALFYMQYDPAKYQNQARLNTNPNGDVGSVSGFDKYEFRPIFWPQLRGFANSIFVGDEYELPQKDLNIPRLISIGDIKYPDGKLALKIVALP
jgi:4-amino-4-deoxy-L-arabinose transferase-like glycosyltransferase